MVKAKGKSNMENENEFYYELIYFDFEKLYERNKTCQVDLLKRNENFEVAEEIIHANDGGAQNRTNSFFFQF